MKFVMYYGLLLILWIYYDLSCNFVSTAREIVVWLYGKPNLLATLHMAGFADLYVLSNRYLRIISPKAELLTCTPRKKSRVVTYLFQNGQIN